MPRRPGIIALSLACALASATASTTASAARAVGGTVVSAANDPMGGATVTILDAKGKVLAITKTDDLGRWKAHIDATTTVRVRVELAGLPAVETPLRPDQLSIRTELQPAAGGVEIEVEGEKPLPKPEPAQPTRYSLEASLLTKLPGTRGDAFAAVTSLPSMGRPPALSTVFVVRGAGPEETATFVDGAPLPQAFHFGGLVAVIPSALLRSITVLPGGFGAPFGRATAGVVDVLLATPPTDRVRGSLGFDALDVGATLTAPVVKGRHETTVSIGARRSHVDAWIGSLLGDTVAGELPRYLDGQFIVEHAFSSRTRVRAAFIGADDGVSVSDPGAPADRPRTGTWRSSVLRAHARMETGFGVGGTGLAVISVGRSRDSIVGENDLWKTERSTLYARLEGTFPIDGPERAKVTIGADAMATRLDGTRVLGVPSSSFGGSAVFQLRGRMLVERVEPGVYAQLAFEPARGFTVTPGLRLDRGVKGEALWQPRVAIRAELSRATAFKALGGLYARSNPHDATDAQDYDGTLLPVPARPGPVKSAHGGLGIEHALARQVIVSADVWGRASDGVLVATQQPARPIYDHLLSGGRTVAGYYYPLNSDTARTRAVGLELMLRFGGEGFAGFVGYALTRAEIRDGPSTAWRRAPFDQTHVLNAAVVQKLGAGWEVGARFRFAAGILDSPYPATEIAPKNDPNVDPNRPLPQLSPLHTLDLRVEKAFTFGEGPAAPAIAAYVEVRNVYDRRAREPLAYNHVYGYPVVGQGLPIIPNIGVRGTF
ncbi:MAG: TonB-dependent receptor [Deltaproteobacteria bacterium]|nr:TonB-dependent receptor [Deltaproteobacteria bacterium]